MSVFSKFRKILVTGTNKGIGLETCNLLAKNKNNIIIAASRNWNYIPTDKDIDFEITESNINKWSRIDILKRKFEHLPNVDFVEMDIRYETSINSSLNYIEEKYENIDVIINNAAIKLKDVDDMNELVATKKHILNNYTGSIKVSSTFIPILNKNGRIIFVSSRSGAISQNLNLDNIDYKKYKFNQHDLTQKHLDDMLKEFMNEVKYNKFNMFQYKQKGYSMSKMALIAYAKILANKYKNDYAISVYSPGICYTSLSHGNGNRLSINGAKGIELLCDMDIKELMNQNHALWGVTETDNDINTAKLIQWDWMTSKELMNIKQNKQPFQIM